MARPAIKVRGLGKEYVIGGRENGRETFREMLISGLSAPVRRFRQLSGAVSAEEESIWALRDVNFDINEGEVVGIIGRNGAGKSTLLKILSRITQPTKGRAEIHGRVASLLEVGTGFHTELTGRENIYLNGAILGMSRREIDRKFDEIVDFSGIEKFLDTPVKRYSSGMYVRLAFAVAAHLDPEILIVDEVLAVGDIEFQRKCLGKMDEVSKRGRTVLLVSHDLRKITSLCERGILLNSGSIESDGAMSSVVDKYLGQNLYLDALVDLTKRGDRSGSGQVRFESLKLVKDGVPCRIFAFGEPFIQKIRVKVSDVVGPVMIACVVKSSEGVPVHDLLNIDSPEKWCPDVGASELTVTADKIALYPGTYSIDLWAGTSSRHRLDYIVEALTFEVIQTPNASISRQLDKGDGLVFQPTAWRYERIQDN